MISSRFAPAVSVLLAVALVPTIMHTYLSIKEDDGRVTGAINQALAGLVSKTTDRRAKWVESTYDTTDWIERRYGGADEQNVLLFVARSDNLKRLYHHPELGVLHGVDFKRPQTVDLPKFNGLAVHLLKSRSGKGMAAYSLLYDKYFVKDPILLQLRTSWELLFSPRKPITLFLVYDDRLMSNQKFETSLAARVLVEAISSFRAQ